MTRQTKRRLTKPAAEVKIYPMLDARAVLDGGAHFTVDIQLGPVLILLKDMD